jgi:hypothetical protein
VLVLVPSLAIAGSWGVRNYVHFGHFAVSERGGSVLLLRAAFLDMDDREYRGAWCTWTPDELGALKTRLCADVTPADTFRFRRPEGKEKGFKELRDHMVRALAAEKADQPRDHQQMLSGLAMLRKDWTRQLWFTPLFAYRGSWVAVHSYRCQEPACGRIGQWGAYTLSVASAYARLLFIPGMMLMLAWGFVRRRHDVTFFLLPAAYSYALHAAATHYLPRYTIMLLPVLATALAMLISLLLGGVRDGAGARVVDAEGPQSPP